MKDLNRKEAAALQLLNGKKEQVSIMQVYKNGNVYIVRRDGTPEIVAGFVLSHWNMRGKS